LKKFNSKIGIIIGITIIIFAIIIGIISGSDLGFLLSGIGTIIMGISILTYINKDNDK
jgi:hypothetical protein